MRLSLLPPSIQALTTELARLPGVGERTALRYAVALVRGGARRTDALQRALQQVKEEIDHCPRCHFWMEEKLCPLCEDSQRSPQRVCVVRDSPDVLALEKLKSHNFRYHVLHGLLAPLSGVGPQQIRLESLFERLKVEGVSELIIALDATVEGDATALYIRDHLKTHFPAIALTRTALGLPAGSSVEFLDPSTLESALLHRTAF